MPKVGKRRRTLSALLTSAGLDAEIISLHPLSIGWPGRGGGEYRDDDGVHFRVEVANESPVIYREYATTTSYAAHHLAKEAFVFRQLSKAGLPIPEILAIVEGSPAGGPPGMLLADTGGEPLQIASQTLPVSSKTDLWLKAGQTLRRLHDLDTSIVGSLNDPRNDRPWMKFVPYFVKALQRDRKRYPEHTQDIDALIGILRSRVQPYLGQRPRSICCGHYSLPGMLFLRRGRTLSCSQWLSLGYYVSVGDPDRDLAGVASGCLRATGNPLPSSFFKGYGRRPDPVCEVVYGAYLSRDRASEIHSTITALTNLDF